MNQWSNYPAAVLRAAPEQVLPALAAHYQTVPTEQLAPAYTCVAKGVAIYEETPRGTLGQSLREHLNVIVAEQQKREEVARG
jgi:hypothetical protein